MIRIIDKSQCCGCTACESICPQQCIHMIEDEEGFRYPVVGEGRDGKKCTNCGLCEKVCHILNRPTALLPLEVYGAKNTNEDERLKSSSGGVFIELAKVILERQGVVFGAVFDDAWEVVIVGSDTMESVRRMMGSKYLQARMETAYKEAQKFLRQGRWVLFSGSPCQVAGLHSFLRRDYDKLLTVDFLCHGAPSPGVWRRYLAELREQLYARRAFAGKNSVSLSLKTTPSVEGVEFREKGMGWKKFRFALTLAEASAEGEKNTVSLSRIFNEDPYMRGFLSDVYLRPSCYGCKSKNGISHSDLTIGDFWGINRIMPDFDDDKGVSLVLVNTEKGGSFFRSLPMEVRQASLANVKSLNGGFNDKLRPHPKRAEFYRRYNEQHDSVEKIVNDILWMPVHRRVAKKVKKLSKFLLKFVAGEKGIVAVKKALGK